MHSCGMFQILKCAVTRLEGMLLSGRTSVCCVLRRDGGGERTCNLCHSNNVIVYYQVSYTHTHTHTLTHTHSHTLTLTLTHSQSSEDDASIHVTIDHSLQHHQRLEEASRGLDHLISHGSSIMGNLQGQRFTLKVGVA